MKFVLSPLVLALIATLLPIPSSAQDKAAAAPAAVATEAPVSMCIGCHSIPGYQASFPRVYRVPKIGGQNPQYIEAALRAYRKGERVHPTMMAIAKGLNDDEIAALAAYYGARGK